MSERNLGILAFPFSYSFSLLLRRQCWSWPPFSIWASPLFPRSQLQMMMWTGSRSAWRCSRNAPLWWTTFSTKSAGSPCLTCYQLSWKRRSSLRRWDLICTFGSPLLRLESWHVLRHSSFFFLPTEGVREEECDRSARWSHFLYAAHCEEWNELKGRPVSAESFSSNGEHAKKRSCWSPGLQTQQGNVLLNYPQGALESETWKLVPVLIDFNY